MTRVPTIYFAGKIGKEDWRTKLFGSRAGGCDSAEAFDTGHTIDMDGFTYGAPLRYGWRLSWNTAKSLGGVPQRELTKRRWRAQPREPDLCATEG